MVGDVLIIREKSTINSYNSKFVLVTSLPLESYLLISDVNEKSYFFIVNMT